MQLELCKALGIGRYLHPQLRMAASKGWPSENPRLSPQVGLVLLSSHPSCLEAKPEIEAHAGQTPAGARAEK